jgi:nucleoside-diphosphate-sugar epimerase
LGSKGYIGRNLNLFLSKKADVFFHSRMEERIDVTVEKIRPNIVINCSASSLREGFNESLEANFLYQSEFLKCLRNLNIPITWVQLASYYELQISLGRSDYYSQHKSAFRNVLMGIHENEKMQVKALFLPHIFGLDEKPSRVIPTIRKMIVGKKRSTFSKGDQYLPLLHINDACEAIWACTVSGQKVSSAAPFWYGRIRELVNLAVGEDISDLAKFDPEDLQVDNFFPKIDFPAAVSNWESKYKLNHLLDYLRN